MSDDPLHLPAELFASAFPFHFAFDRELRLVACGRSLGRVLPELVVGAPVAEYLDLKRPGVEWDFDALQDLDQQLFLIQARDRPVLLRGQLVRLPDPEVLLFLGSPWLGEADPFADLGLRMEDFALHDPATDVMHLLRVKESAMQETRELASRLEQANQALKDQYARLRSAESRTRAIVEGAVDSIVVIDERGTIEVFNPAAEKLFGYAAREAVGNNVRMLMPPGEAAQHDGYLARFLETGEARVIGIGREVMGERKDGSRFPLDLSVSEVPAGDSRQFVGILRDISERKEAESRLHDITSRLRTLIQSLHGGLLFEDEKRKVVLANEQFCSMFGVPVPVEALVGTDCAEAATQSKVLFRDPEQFIERVDELLVDRKVVAREPLQMVDGRVLERDYLPIFVDEKYRGHLWLYRDVTDRAHAERALVASESLKRATLETALDAIVSIDAEGTVVEWNPTAEEIFGWQREEVLGRSMGELIVPEGLRERHAEGVARYVSTGESVILGQRLELSALRRDGTEFPCELAITAHESGEDPIFTAFIRDISDQRRAAEALEAARAAAEAANRMKSMFVANVSHEMRTPLNSILGCAELLGDGELTSDASDLLATIENSAQALLFLIRDFLDLSKIEAGQLDIEEEPFELAELVRSVARLVERPAHVKGLHLQIAAPPPVKLVGDSSRIQQILVNLLTNAIKFTAHGQVTLEIECAKSAEREGHRRLVVRVRDTGIGIPDAYRMRIFQRFVQVEDSGTRAAGGTGLGLSICRALALRMGGQVHLESSQPGVGSCFSLEVDLAVASQSTKTIALSDADAVPVAAPRRILLADDSVDGRRVFVRFLESGGHRVDTAEDGPTVVALAEERRHDLVLMDVEMPGYDGFEATRRIRAFEREHALASVPIVALTAHALGGFRERCLEAGMDEFLTKPVRRAVLLDAVTEFAAGTPRASRTEKAPVEPADDRVTIHVESAIQDLIPDFLRNRRQELDAMSGLLEQGNLEPIRVMGHNLKASAVSYGFDELGNLGRELEAAAETQDRDRIAQLARRMARFLDRVHIVTD